MQRSIALLFSEAIASITIVRTRVTQNFAVYCVSTPVNTVKASMQ